MHPKELLYITMVFISNTVLHLLRFKAMGVPPPAGAIKEEGASASSTAPLAPIATAPAGSTLSVSPETSGPSQRGRSKSKSSTVGPG